MISLKNKILELVNFCNCLPDFELWNIRTSVENILRNFYETYKLIEPEILKSNDRILIAYETSDEESTVDLDAKNSKKYFLKIDSFVVTPTNNRNSTGEISDSTMRQYLEILIAFGVIRPSKEIYYGPSMLTGFFNLNFKLLQQENINDFLSRCFYNLKGNLKDQRTKSRRIFYTAMLDFLASYWDEDDFILCKRIEVKNPIPTKVSVITDICQSAGLKIFSKLFINIAWYDDEIIDEIKNILVGL